MHTAKIEIRECVKWSLTMKIINLQAQKVVAVAYRRWSFTRGSNCKALTGKVLVFWIGGRLWEVVAHEGSTVFTSVSGGSSPRSWYFTSVTGRIGVHTAPKYSRRPIRYSRSARFSFATSQKSRHHKRSCVRTDKLSGYDFRGGTKPIQYSVNIA